MNIEYAVRNLEEASEHLKTLAADLKTRRSVTALEHELLAWMQEIYWHINRVWNARRVPQPKIDAECGKLWDSWCRFPKDLDLG